MLSSQLESRSPGSAFNSAVYSRPAPRDPSWMRCMPDPLIGMRHDSMPWCSTQFFLLAQPKVRYGQSIAELAIEIGRQQLPVALHELANRQQLLHGVARIARLKQFFGNRHPELQLHAEVRAARQRLAILLDALEVQVAVRPDGAGIENLPQQRRHLPRARGTEIALLAGHQDDACEGQHGGTLKQQRPPHCGLRVTECGSILAATAMVSRASALFPCCS